MNFESKWFKKFDDISFVKITSKCILLLFIQDFCFRPEAGQFVRPVLLTLLNLLATFFAFFFLGGIGYLGKPWAEETQNNRAQ